MAWGFRPPQSTAAPTIGQVYSDGGHPSTKSWHFSGSDDAVEITGIDDVFYSGGGTIAVWAYALTGGGGTNGFIASSLGSNQGFSWHLNAVDGTDNRFHMRLSYQFSTTDGLFDGKINIIDLDMWSLLMVSYDPSDVTNVPRMWANGFPIQMAVTQTPVGSAVQNTGGLVLGNNAISGGVRNWDGYMHQLGIWAGAELTGEERAQVNNSGIVSDWSEVQASNLNGLYLFGDDGSDNPTTATSGLQDQSGNGNHGDPKNMVAGNQVTLAA